MALNKKQRLRKKADSLWKEIVLRRNNKVCELTGQAYALDPHHFYPKGLYGHLRYCLENGIALQKGLHFAHHHKGDPEIHQRIIAKRGQKWFKSLQQKARERQPISYQTIEYYEKTIERLTKVLKELKDE